VTLAYVMSKENAWIALKRITRILRMARVPYCLDGGVLLGFVREGWFLDHDDDVDITLLEQHDHLKRIKQLAYDRGFRKWDGRTPELTKWVPPKRTDGSKKLQFRYEDVLVDIVSKRLRDGMAVWSLYTDTTWKAVPAEYYQKLGRITIRGVTFSVPKDTEGYLTTRFGADWRTPKVDYVKARDDKAYGWTPPDSS